MRTPVEATTAPFSALVRREWAAFRTRGRIVAMTCAALVHQPLGPGGSITVRMTSMTGIITYPPPDHDEIVPGLVPWAKAGIIVKDGLRQGSSYAALMVTGAHGVRMQHDYVHDTAGSPGGVSEGSPRWLRLTRSGDTITGHESADGTRWTEVGTARLAGLPETVQVGLFVTSPGDLTLRKVALGARIPESRFTQASATFDSISVAGAAGSSGGGWSRDAVGEMGHTDWEKYHRAAGLVESNGAFTVTGSGDIGPAGEEGHSLESHLFSLVISLIIVLVVAVRFTTAGGAPLTGRVLAAKAVVAGSAAFLAGLVSAAVVMPLGTAILRADHISVIPVSPLTGVRVAVAVGALLGLAAAGGLALRVLLRRARAAILVVIAALVLPYLMATLPLLPDEVSRWLLRVTPAAGFAVKQTLHEYPQVLAHYAPSAGYFPLAWWAGFAVLCAYAAALLILAARRLPRTGSTTA
ncbi:hypothetical protein [Micromonospora sp. CPCC 206061]|uniref:hypothetical protein n=1 Tax=Micromonospora sp. CPCC 206061 TaxID=3122410 RepID=UPI002FF2A04B